MSTKPESAPKERIVRIFLHIEKTAGTSIRESLIAACPCDKVALVYPHHQCITLAQFMAFSKEKRDSFDYIFGHFFFGIHLLTTRVPAYVTFLRDPIQRIMSHYWQFRMSAPILLGNGDGTELPIGGQNVPLSMVVEQGLIQEFDNFQTRVLTAAGTQVVDPGLMTRHHVEMALDCVRQYFDFVGRYETLERDWRSLTEMLGLPPVPLRKSNVSQSHDALPPDDDFRRIRWDIVAERNHLDAELYAAISRLPGPVLRRRHVAQVLAPLAGPA